MEFKKGQVVVVWVGNVTYPGAVESVNNNEVEIKSIENKGLKYIIKLDKITAVSIDENVDTVEKLEAQRKAFEEKQKAAAEAMRKAAEEEAELEKSLRNQ